MNWGTRIVISFIAFAIVIFTMVIISMNQDINLVSEDYYRQEIAYEEQIERLRNTSNLVEQPSIILDRSSRFVMVRFPKELLPEVEEGIIHMFRPSDSGLDKRYVLELDDEGVQYISIEERLKGLWRIKLLWKSQELEFYQETILNF